jgi:hypothetical protein
VSKNPEILEYLNTAQAAAYLNISKQWLEAKRSSGGNAPPVVRIGRVCRYRRSALDKWALEQEAPNAERFNAVRLGGSESNA